MAGDQIDQGCRFAHEPDVEATSDFPQTMETPAPRPYAARISRTLNRFCAPHAVHRSPVGCVVFFYLFSATRPRILPPGETL